MSVTEAKSLMLRLGIHPRKSKGQSFLIDREVLNRCAEYAKIRSGERILEIGPGLGFLTEELLRKDAMVIAVESDPKLCDYLENRFQTSLTLIRGDATKVDLPPFDKVVSNLPYQISSEITFRILERKFDLAVLMYQKEFAERLVSGEGSSIYGRLSVMAAYRAESEILEIIDRKAFWPVPRVDSALVLMKARPKRFAVKNERLFIDVVRVLFSHRRKKIANSLLSGAHQLNLSKERIREILDELPHSEERVEHLTPQEIAEIADYVNSL